MANNTHRFRGFRAKLEESTALRYALAPVCIAVAVVLHISVIGPVPMWSLSVPPIHPTGLFQTCIVAAAWFGGAGPGFLAALLATLVLPLLIDMNYPLIAGFFDLPRFLPFGITGIAVGWGTSLRKRAEAALRRSERELRKARNELEMKVAERTAELRRSEALLAEAQKLSQTGSFGWNVATGELFWSEETFRIVGYDLATQPTLERVFQRVHPEDIARVREALDRGVQTGTDLDFEHRFLMPDGAVKHVHVVAQAVRDEQGNLEYVGAVMDITAHKRAQQALERALQDMRALQAQHRLVIDSIPGLVWSARPDGLDFVNQRWLDYTGLTQEEALGRGWEAAVHLDDLTRLLETQRAAVAAGKPWEMETRLRRFDGAYRWFSIRGVPLQDECGRVAKWYGTNTDIEDRKRAEEALRQTQAALAHVARVATLGELTASIAHEINQPLGAMVNSANACVRWLAAENLARAQQSAVRIVAEGQRAADIIDRIRALTKKTPPHKDWLDLNATIRDVLALARSEVHRHRVVVETHLAEEVPLVRADRIQIQQVLLNVLINALEALSGGGDGPREVVVQSDMDTAQDVRVTVRDSGPGLDPQQLDRLFEAFYTTKPHGLGLGLAISRSIIAAHGGRLWATANVPRGAVFQFTVPRGSEEGA
jgi:PAS domain S-box-containing protein